MPDARSWMNSVSDPSARGDPARLEIEPVSLRRADLASAEAPPGIARSGKDDERRVILRSDRVPLVEQPEVQRPLPAAAEVAHTAPAP